MQVLKPALGLGLLQLVCQLRAGGRRAFSAMRFHCGNHLRFCVNQFLGSGVSAQSIRDFAASFLL